MLCNNGRHAAYTGTGESASARARRRRGPADVGDKGQGVEEVRPCLVAAYVARL